MIQLLTLAEAMRESATGKVRAADGVKRRPTLRFLTAPRAGGGAATRVLHGEIDADAADRRHRVWPLADAEAIRRHHRRSRSTGDAQEFDIVPAFQFADAVGEKRRHPHDLLAKGRQPLLPHKLRSRLSE